MATKRCCGPWRETALGQVRRCNNPLLPEESSFEIARAVAAADALFGVSDEEPQQAEPETTPPPELPELPERKTPPASERVVITERTNEAARKLIASVFGASEGEQS